VNQPERPDGILGRITPPPSAPRVPASSIDVLLVHTDARFTAKVTTLLRKNAYTVVEVEGGAEALETVRRGCVPRLVVLDVDGASREELGALAGLQGEGACARTAFLTLSRTGGDAPGGLRREGSLLKPIEAAELVDAVRRLCGPG
jgi:DNA-binding response OmpR family regulator